MDVYITKHKQAVINEILETFDCAMVRSGTTHGVLETEISLPVKIIASPSGDSWCINLYLPWIDDDEAVAFAWIKDVSGTPTRQQVIDAIREKIQSS